MAKCKACGEEAEDLVSRKVAGKRKRVCGQCAEQIDEEETIAEMSLDAMRDMMGYKGQW